MQVSFSETTEQHRARLATTGRYVKARRRVLILKHAGLTPVQIADQMGQSNTSWDLLTASIQQLAADLHVVLVGDTYQPDGYAAVAEDLSFLQIVGQTQGFESQKRDLAADGHLVGQPYGYHPARKPLPATTVPHEAEAVRKTIAAITAGKNLVQIAEDLNRAGYPTPSGGTAWTNGTVRELVRRLPVYCGYTLHRDAALKKEFWYGEIFQGRHEPIISLADAEAVLTALGRTFTWTFVPTTLAESELARPQEIRRLLELNRLAERQQAQAFPGA